MHSTTSTPSSSLPVVQPGALLPIERRALTDDVVTTLRKAILSGAFAPGDRLPEAATAAQLHVSRVPVREAMLQLEREGLLTFDQRGSASVRKLTAQDF